MSGYGTAQAPGDTCVDPLTPHSLTLTFFSWETLVSIYRIRIYFRRQRMEAPLTPFPQLTMYTPRPHFRQSDGKTSSEKSTKIIRRLQHQEMLLLEPKKTT